MNNGRHPRRCERNRIGRTQANGAATAERHAAVARLLTGDSTATAEDGVRWVRALVAELRIPGLRTYGVTAQDVPVLVEKAARASSMKSNPVALSAEQMAAILHAAI